MRRARRSAAACSSEVGLTSSPSHFTPTGSRCAQLHVRSALAKPTSRQLGRPSAEHSAHVASVHRDGASKGRLTRVGQRAFERRTLNQRSSRTIHDPTAGSGLGVRTEQAEAGESAARLPQPALTRWTQSVSMLRVPRGSMRGSFRGSLADPGPARVRHAPFLPPRAPMLGGVPSVQRTPR